MTAIRPVSSTHSDNGPFLTRNRVRLREVMSFRSLSILIPMQILALLFSNKIIPIAKIIYTQAHRGSQPLRSIASRDQSIHWVPASEGHCSAWVSGQKISNTYCVFRFYGSENQLFNELRLGTQNYKYKQLGNLKSTMCHGVGISLASENHIQMHATDQG
jgi:hypothetical protein